MVTSSTGLRVKTDGHITTNLYSEPSILPEAETEAVNSIYLPRVIVKSLHNSAVKQGICSVAEEDQQNISCSCHANEQRKLPIIYITELKDGEKVAKMVKPRDYLGEPYLKDYQVLCKSLLVDS